MQQIQPAYVVYQPQNSGIIKHFNSTISRALGITQIIAGALCVIANIVGIVLGAGISVVGHGIWGGAFFIVTGSIGVGASTRRTKCMIIAYMVLSIIAASVFSWFIIGFSASGFSMDRSYHYRWLCDDYRCRDGDYRIIDKSRWDAKKAVHGMLICLALIQGLLGIFAAVQGCATVCCRCCRSPSPEPGNQQWGQSNIGVQNQPGQPGHIILTIPQISPVQQGTQFIAVPQNMTSSPMFGCPQGITVQQAEAAGAAGTAAVAQMTGGATGYSPEVHNGNIKQGSDGLTAPAIQTGSLPPAYSYIQST